MAWSFTTTADCATSNAAILRVLRKHGTASQSRWPGRKVRKKYGQGLFIARRAPGYRFRFDGDRPMAALQLARRSVDGVWRRT